MTFSFVGESAVRNTEDTYHYRYPEDRSATFGDFKAQEEFRVK